MLLGFIVSECGIEANPEKIMAVTQMGPIQNIKGCSGPWDASRLSTASYCASTSEVSLSTVF
jgi:hypothetical protein